MKNLSKPIVRLLAAALAGLALTACQAGNSAPAASEAEAWPAPAETAAAGQAADYPPAESAAAGMPQASAAAGSRWEPYPAEDSAPEEGWQGTADGESYHAIDEDGFLRAARDPLSTFSVDSDSAAYGNIRRMLRDGTLIPPDAVRIEEMVNYFHYSYPQPKGDDPFAIYTEYSRCPWNPGHGLLLVGLQARDPAPENLPPSNLVFLVDVSGSMEDANKLPLVRRAFSLLAQRLGARDTVSIVTYASGVRLVLDGAPGSAADAILSAIDGLEAGGSTNGAGGLQMAYDVARAHFLREGNNRVILATDGDFNVGPSSDDEMGRLITKERKSGVFLSVLGFGMGNLKDDKLETLAQNGNGNYAYIDSIQEARKALVKQMGGTLNTVAKDVKLQVEFNPALVRGYRLLGYENSMLEDTDFADDRVDGGEVGAGHQATALYEIVPADGEGDDGGKLATVSLRCKEPDGSRSRQLDAAVRFTLRGTPTQSCRFAAAVAEFGLLLRNSEYRGEASYGSILQLIGHENQTDSLRREFVDLVQAAREQGYR